MHQLILLRHAKANQAAAGGADHERALSPAGERAAQLIGTAMRKAGLAPDVVLVSSALRTQQTLEIVEASAAWDERPNIDTLPSLYMATQGQIRDLLRALPETVRSALVVGHNPGLQDLAQSLAAGNQGTARLAEDYPTAGLAEFLVTTPWHRLGPTGCALQRFVQPADQRTV
jgi:phosphohistidine phosphatase